MANPVAALDLRLASRRSQVLMGRFLYALWMLAQAAFLGWLWSGWPVPVPVTWDLTEIVELYLELFLLQHFLLLLIVVPAYLAGAITDEKAKGTLLLLLAADVSPWQIVVGKLEARLLQVAPLALIGLPLFCFVGVCLGFMGWSTILGLVILTVTGVFALGAVSLWVSVCSPQARTAALRLFVGLGLVLLAAWGLVNYGLPFLLKSFSAQPEVVHGLTRVKNFILGFDPFYVLAPSWKGSDADEFWSRLRFAAGGYVLGGAFFLVLAAWRLRREAIRYLEQGESKPRQGWKRHPVEDDPVSWRERLAGRKAIHWIGAALLLIATTEACRWMVPAKPFWYFAALWSVAGIVLSMPISIRASGAITGERDRQTWDTLLLSPLETWEIIVDKRRGVLQSFFPYFLAFLVPALLLSVAAGTRAVLLSLAMLLVWGAALYLMASTGVWCSASSRSSWRSLVATVGRGYGLFLGLLTIVAAVYVAFACALTPAAGLLSKTMGITSIPEDPLLGVVIITCLYLAWRLHKAADTRLWLAQTWIDTRERYGRTFTRSLTRALKKARERQDARKQAAEMTALARRRVMAEDPPRYSS